MNELTYCKVIGLLVYSLLLHDIKKTLHFSLSPSSDTLLTSFIFFLSSLFYSWFIFLVSLTLIIHNPIFFVTSRDLSMTTEVMDVYI